MKTNKPESQYNMIDWWKKAVFENYANFDGRARRSEFWYFRLACLVLYIALMFPVGFIMVLLPDDQAYLGLIPFGLGLLLMIIPSYAVAARRLHDTDKSGWLLLLGMIPIVSYIGGIILLVFYCTEGSRGRNQYGADPKNHETNMLL